MNAFSRLLCNTANPKIRVLKVAEMAVVDVLLGVLKGIALVFDAVTLPVYWMMQRGTWEDRVAIQ